MLKRVGLGSSWGQHDKCSLCWWLSAMGQQVKLYIAYVTDPNMNLGFAACFVNCSNVLCRSGVIKVHLWWHFFPRWVEASNPYSFIVLYKGLTSRLLPTFHLPSFLGISTHTSPKRGDHQETCVGTVTDQTSNAQVPFQTDMRDSLWNKSNRLSTKCNSGHFLFFKKGSSSNLLWDPCG